MSNVINFKKAKRKIIFRRIKGKLRPIRVGAERVGGMGKWVGKSLRKTPKTTALALGLGALGAHKAKKRYKTGTAGKIIGDVGLGASIVGSIYSAKAFKGGLVVYPDMLKKGSRLSRTGVLFMGAGMGMQFLGYKSKKKK